MSDPTPFPSAEPEYLGADPAARPARSRGRQRALLVGAALGVAVVGAGGWGLAQLMAGGSDPATAVPANAVGYLAVDLDPSASQKIEALRMAKKFPALAEELDLGVRDDVRRWVFEQMQQEMGCTLDYGRDVEPWIGDRMAVAAVPDDDAPVAPVLVVQVSDEEAARDAVTALEKCAADKKTFGGSADPDKPSGPAGVAFVGDYMLVTEEQDDADAFAKAAGAASLADDPAFGEWMDRVGDPGVVTAYASADAPRLMAAAGEDFGATPMPGMDDDRLRTLWKDFDGIAGVLRFADGTMEAEMAGAGLPAGMASGGEPTGPSLADLPDSTAAAFTVSLPDGWLQGYADALFGMLSGGESEQEFWDGMEAGSGLQLPEDIETLFGDGISLAVDSSADFDAASTSSRMLPPLPLALRIAGDEQEVTRVLDRVLALAGPMADEVATASAEGVVVVGLDQAYVDELAGPGSLGEQDVFTRVVPEADRAVAGLFVDFASVQTWAKAVDDPELSENLAPLDALGASSWRDGDVQHGLLRLTTD